jgi:type VI secretion system protein ImpF
VAELSHKEHLQPSLLDRLTHDKSLVRVNPHTRDGLGGSGDGDKKRPCPSCLPGKEMLSMSDLRDRVLRDLESLLNTTRPAAAFGQLEDDPVVAGSVIHYGIPDLAGRTVSSIDVRALERALRQAIWDFEPRLARSSVTVRGILDDREMSHNAISFVIEADLWGQPLPLHLALRTRVDLEDGRVQVHVPGKREV